MYNNFFPRFHAFNRIPKNLWICTKIWSLLLTIYSVFIVSKIPSIRISYFCAKDARVKETRKIRRKIRHRHSDRRTACFYTEGSRNGGKVWLGIAVRVNATSIVGVSPVRSCSPRFPCPDSLEHADYDRSEPFESRGEVLPGLPALLNILCHGYPRIICAPQDCAWILNRRSSWLSHLHSRFEKSWL